MTDRLSFSLDAEGQLQQRLAAVLSGLQRPVVLMEAIGGRLKTNIQFRFETKTDPNGVPWLPLAPSTRAQYDKADTGRDGTLRRRGSLLQRTGLMLESLTVNAAPDSVEVGFTRPYAIWHILGTQRMPRRDPMFGDAIAGRLGDQDRQDVLDELEAFLSDALG